VRAVVVLVVAGISFDIAGILLVAAEDIAPMVTGATSAVLAAVTRASRRAEAAWRRVLRRPKNVTAHDGGAGLSVAFGGRVTGMTSTSAETLEGRVDYLLRESERTQRRLNEVEEGLVSERATREREMETLDERVGYAITESQWEAWRRYVRLRRLGLVCLVVGAALLAVANLV